MNIWPTIVIGESRLFREGLACLLSKSPYKVTCIGDVREVPKILDETDKPPKLVIFGLAVDDEECVDQLKSIRAGFPDCKIVVLASARNRLNFTRCLTIGIDGYLLNDVSPEVLSESLQLIFLGEKVFPSILAAWIVGGEEHDLFGHALPNDKELSRREIEILCFLIEGKSNKSIARRLQITDATVKIHLRRILNKIGAANRTQAAVWAVNNGLALPDRSAVGQRAAPAKERTDSANPSRTRATG